MQDQQLARCQQIDHTVSIVHLSLHIAPSGIYILHQCPHMYYTQLAVSREEEGRLRYFLSQFLKIKKEYSRAIECTGFSEVIVQQMQDVTE